MAHGQNSSHPHYLWPTGWLSLARHKGGWAIMARRTAQTVTSQASCLTNSLVTTC